MLLRFEKKYEESMAKVRAGAKKVTFKESSTREKIDDYGSSMSSSSRKSLQKASPMFYSSLNIF